MKVYSLIPPDDVAVAVGYAHTNKKISFSHNFMALSTSTDNKEKIKAERIAEILKTLSQSANPIGEYSTNIIKPITAIPHCYEVRERNVRIPFIFRNGKIIVLLCLFKKSKHGFDKQQEKTLKKLAKEINGLTEIVFTEDRR